MIKLQKVMKTQKTIRVGPSRMKQLKLKMKERKRDRRKKSKRHKSKKVQKNL